MALKCHELLGGKGEGIPPEVEVKTEEEHCCIVLLMGSLILIPPSLPVFWLLFSSPPLQPLSAARR